METPQPTFKEKDATMLLAALQNTRGPIIVDKAALAKQLALAEKTISNQFARIKKEYNLDVSFSSGGGGGGGSATPKKRKGDADIEESPVPKAKAPKAPAAEKGAKANGKKGTKGVKKGLEGQENGDGRAASEDEQKSGERE